MAPSPVATTLWQVMAASDNLVASYPSNIVVSCHQSKYPNITSREWWKWGWHQQLKKNPTGVACRKKLVCYWDGLELARTWFGNLAQVVERDRTWQWKILVIFRCQDGLLSLPPQIMIPASNLQVLCLGVEWRLRDQSFVCGSRLAIKKQLASIFMLFFKYNLHCNIVLWGFTMLHGSRFYSYSML